MKAYGIRDKKAYFPCECPGCAPIGDKKVVKSRARQKSKKEIDKELKECTKPKGKS